MALDRLWTGNARPSPKNTSAVYAEDVNPIIDKLNSLESSTHAQHSDDQDLSGLLTLDQTTPQTFINGIPALSADREILLDNQLTDKKYVDTVQSGGMKSFFFTKIASDVAGMYKAITTTTVNLIQSITATAVDGETIIASFITDVAVAPYRVIEGSRFFHFTAKASSIAKPTQLRGYIYTTDINGANPVLLRTSTLTIPLTVLSAEYAVSVWGESLNIPITTRIKFVVSVIKSGGGVDPTVTMYVDDDTFSRLDVPSPTGVTDITGLVPYTGATADVDLGTHSLKTDEIKTTVSKDLLITTGVEKTVIFATPTYRDEYPAMIIPVGGSAAPDEVAHTIGGVLRSIRGFDGSATEERMSGSFEIPHDYMVGQPIEAHVHWRPSTTGTGTVIWYFDWEYSPPDAAPIAQTTISLTATLVTNKQYWHLLSSFGNLPQPSTPFSLGGKIGFNIRRSPTTDTYGADTLLEQIAMHVPCDTLGSRQLYIK